MKKQYLIVMIIAAIFFLVFPYVALARYTGHSENIHVMDLLRCALASFLLATLAKKYSNLKRGIISTFIKGTAAALLIWWSRMFILHGGHFGDTLYFSCAAGGAISGFLIVVPELWSSKKIA